MPPADAPPASATAPDATAGYAPTLNGGFQAVAESTQQIHAAIADKVFGSVLRVPGFATPARIAKAAHDSIASGIYGVIRSGADAAFGLAGHVEQLARDPLHEPGAAEQSFRSALNAVVGDALQGASSSVAVRMELRTGTAALAVTPEALSGLRRRVCVFIHGLGCDESSWWRKPEAWNDAEPSGPAQQGAGSARPTPRSAPDGRPHYGTWLEREPELSAIYLRYNTGLSLDANAALLAALLEQAARAAPQVGEWLLIGHSMGGLVARRAHELAALEHLPWTRRAPMLVCLGSPHHGAPLERIGRLAAAALHVSDVTRPLARLANARSQGIRDLRRGLKNRPPPIGKTPAMRFVAATLAADPGSRLGKALGESIGDGLVPVGSAIDEGASGDVQYVVLAGLGHMDLLNHPRVYAAIRPWIVGGG